MKLVDSLSVFIYLLGLYICFAVCAFNETKFYSKAYLLFIMQVSMTRFLLVFESVNYFILLTLKCKG